MSLKLDELDAFKKHRNVISESLTTKIVGREREIDDICDLLFEKNFVAITGHAGIGKSRLAVAAIERYSSKRQKVKVLCLKSFGDYMAAINELLEDLSEYLFLIDDASDFKKIDEVIKCFKYHRGNVKAIFTVRDYLRYCVDDEEIIFYEIGPLDNETIKKAIVENTSIRNNEWLNKIADISKGNIRFAFVNAAFALNSKTASTFLFNAKDIMGSFYKKQIVNIGESYNLLITAGIISFFKSVYLNQLIYISPILKNAGISKREFLHYVNTLKSMELVDEYVDVVKISDQCFADYLLYYVFVEKKYLKIKDLIINTYKYYKKRIIESLNTILGAYLTSDSFTYLKDEALGACASIEDVGLKHNIEVAFAPLMLDHTAIEFKKGVEEYTDKKDIKWLLELFSTLAKNEYQSVAIEGIMCLLEKTKLKKEKVFKAINETFMLGYEDVKMSFKYLSSFVDYLTENNIHDDHFFSIVSYYLKYTFRNSKFISETKVEICSFNLTNNMDGVIPFRRRCWNYVFDYGIDKALNIIVDFAKSHITDNAETIVTSDLKLINGYLEDYECKELIQAVLYVEFKEDAENYGFEDLLFSSTKYSDILKLILEGKPYNQNCSELNNVHVENLRIFYSKNKSKVFDMVNHLDEISNYYNHNIKDFLSTILECLDEFSPSILNIFVRYKVFPYSVVEKVASIVELNVLYINIKNIDDIYMKEEYLYAFYLFVNNQKNKDTFEFSSWIKSKPDPKMEPIFMRNALSLRKIAERSGISYIKLVKIVFKKKEYNKLIAKEYLSYLFFKDGAFKEILDSDKDLAIAIYEFLFLQKENDYRNKALKTIISAKRSYIKTFAERYLENGVPDESGLDDIIFDGDNYKRFFDKCIEIGETKLPYFISLNLQRLISRNLRRTEMIDWVLCYIEKNHKDDKAMESLFSILAGIESDYRNSFILKYYEKGKNERVLKFALTVPCESYFLNFAESYFNAKIRSLYSLKTDLIKWDNLNLVSFIDKLIDKYKEDLSDSKIYQLIECIDPSLSSELQEIDSKTEVSLSDAFRVYLQDENFRRLLSSGYVTCKDGCFVSESNNPLKFADVIKDRKIIGVKVVQVIDDIDVRYEQNLSTMKGIVKNFGEGNQTTLIEYLYSIFLEKGWTVKEFTQETLLTRDLFSKIKNKKRKSLEKKTLIQILIGLKLPKKQRDYLLEKNGTQLSIFNEDDALYEYILASGISIDDADALLKEVGKEGFS